MTEDGGKRMRDDEEMDERSLPVDGRAGKRVRFSKDLESVREIEPR